MYKNIHSTEDILRLHTFIKAQKETGFEPSQIGNIEEITLNSIIHQEIKNIFAPCYKESAQESNKVIKIIRMDKILPIVEQ